MPRYDFDLFTIGAGSGGVAGSRRAGSYGARVAICEESRVGGTCVMRGCVPKKLLVYGAQFADAFADAAGFGWNVPVPSFDWPSLIAAKDKEIDRLEQIYRTMLKNGKVELIEGHGVVIDPHTVEVGGRTYTADKIMIAAGGHPTVPSIPGIEHVISSNEALYLPSLPRRIVIVGGGYIAVEFAGIFRGFRQRRSSRSSGARSCSTASTTTCAWRWRRRCAIAASRSTPAPRSRASRSSRTGYSVFTTHGEEISADLVMYATGRKPNTRGLGLAEIGVELNHEGAVVVDEWQRSTRAQHLRCRRRDRPAEPDAGGDRRGPRHRRDPLQRQPDQDGPRGRADRGVQPAADRHGRADRGGGAPRNTARSTSTAPASGR